MALAVSVVGLTLAPSTGCVSPGGGAESVKAPTPEDRRAAREDILRELEKSLPYDHPDVLSARVDLAMSLVELGRLEEAGDLLDQSLVVMSIIPPLENPRVWRARSWRARVALEQSDARLARHLLQSVVVQLERSLPPDHPDLLDARARLAAATEAIASD